MIKVQNNTATREPLPAFLRGLKPKSLANLSWTDPALGVQDAVWWPEERNWPELQEGERYTDEVLTLDYERKVVVSTRQTEPDPDYVPPQPEIPESCTRRQGRLALLQVGKLEMVEEAIESIESPTEKATAHIEYEADTWERENPFLQAMWSRLGGTSEELDGLFALAVSL